MDKVREEFEAWAINCDLCTFAIGDEYKYMATEWAWRAWKASRAALCVELPRCWNDEQRDYRDNMVDRLDDVGVSHK